MPVRQGVIPAAGSGSCPGLSTNAIPKELLPVIERVVGAMHLAGIIGGNHVAGTPRDLMQANEWYLRENGHMEPDLSTITRRDKTFGW